MKKYVVVLLSVLVAASMLLSACAPAAAPTAAPVAPAATMAPAATAAPASTGTAVGIVLPTKDEPRWIQDQTRFSDALTAAGFTSEILFSQGDSAKEKANVESLLTKGIKVLIICPQDAAAAGAAVDEAHKAGVKVISYDRLVTGTDAVDFYVTFDSMSVGKAQAQYLVDHNTAKGTPLFLYAGAASDNNAFLFFEGAWEVLQPKIADGTFVIKNSTEAVGLQANAKLTRDQESKIIGQVTTNWDFNTAKNLSEANLTAATAADKGTVAILAPNDGTARAIADAFAADKDVKGYTVTGQDAEKASVQYIIDGKQSMTVFKDVRTLVKDAITAAVTMLGGGTPKSTNTYNNGKIDVPAAPSAVVTVDKSNVKAALVDSGYYKDTDFTNLSGAAAAAPTAAPAGTAPDCTQATVFCVGVVTDVGKVDDKSFNQSAWEGIQQTQKDGGADWIQYIETTDSKDYAKNIATFGDAGYKVIVTVGFNLTEPTYAAAKLYPNVKFIGIDQFLMKDDKHTDWPLANLVGLVYNEDQSGFLVGALAAMMSKSHKIGGVFGTDAVPPVWRYGEGYRAGALYEDKKNGTKTEVTNVYHSDVGFDKTFSDPTWGADTAKSIVSKGADVIFGGGGKTGNGAVDEAAQLKVLAIGVDTDQYATLPEADAYLLTSALKPIPAPLEALVKLAKAGQFPTTGFFLGGGGYAPYHDLASKVDPKIDAEMQAISKGLADGSIKTNVAPAKP